MPSYDLATFERLSRDLTLPWRLATAYTRKSNGDSLAHTPGPPTACCCCAGPPVSDPSWPYIHTEQGLEVWTLPLHTRVSWCGFSGPAFEDAIECLGAVAIGRAYG